jgi:hypothetical protein
MSERQRTLDISPPKRVERAADDLDILLRHGVAR